MIKRVPPLETPAVEHPADTRDMLVVHTALRREFRLAAGLVRATTTGDLKRARTVADHLGLIARLLHHHHGGEDRLLWPLLLERVADEFTPTVLLMEAQHERLGEQLDIVQELRARFATAAGPQEQADLAAGCDRLHAMLDEHLGAEEQRLLPIAARYVTAQEWEKLGEEGLGTLPKRQLPLVFGLMSYEGDPEVLKLMLSAAPAPVRLLLPRLARRAFKRYARRVHRTAAP